MKLIIAGGREYQFTETDIERLNEVLEDYDVQEVVSGKARGADTEGEEWAKSHIIPVKEFPAEWEKYGRRAGGIRNQQMADYADALVVFKGGTGTADMIRRAKKQGLTIFDFQEKPLTFEDLFDIS